MAKEELYLKKVELKVSVNCCEGCRRKVVKALSIKGVLKTEIHPTLAKITITGNVFFLIITITGNVDVSTLIKKLAKRGKSAELWPSPETKKQDKEEKKSESGNSIDNEKAKAKEISSNENHEKLAESSNKKVNKSNSSNAPQDDKATTNDNEKEEDVKGNGNGNGNENYQEKTMAEDGKSSYQTVMSAIPHVNYLVNPNVMPPQIQGYYPMSAPYYTMNTYSAPPPSCCIPDRCHCQQPSYQSQQNSTGFGDYFNDENTARLFQR